MVYAFLSEGMTLEQRAAFDLSLAATLEPAGPAPVRAAGKSVAEQNREAVRSWAAAGVPVAVPE